MKKFILGIAAISSVIFLAGCTAIDPFQDQQLPLPDALPSQEAPAPTNGPVDAMTELEAIEAGKAMLYQGPVTLSGPATTIVKIVPDGTAGLLSFEVILTEAQFQEFLDQVKPDPSMVGGDSRGGYAAVSMATAESIVEPTMYQEALGFLDQFDDLVDYWFVSYYVEAGESA